MSPKSDPKSAILLDVNVLIGLLDDESPFHDKAIRWFKSISEKNYWATCPIVENGFIRIVSGSKYSGDKITPLQAQSVLTALKNFSSKYIFWPNSISICNVTLFDLELIQGSSQLTDLYLLGLCQKNKGKLATFDKRIFTTGLSKPSKDLIQLIQ